MCLRINFLPIWSDLSPHLSPTLNHVCLLCFTFSILTLLEHFETSNMDLINWSLNAFDQIWSTCSAGLREASCPSRAFPAGHSRDSWNQWREICLTVFSVENMRDVFLFGFMIACLMLVGLSIGIVYRRIKKTETLKRCQTEAKQRPNRGQTEAKRRPNSSP